MSGGTRSDCSPADEWIGPAAVSVTLQPALSTLVAAGGSVIGTADMPGTMTYCSGTQSVTDTSFQVTGTVSAGGQMTLTFNVQGGGCTFTATGTTSMVAGTIPSSCFDHPGSAVFYAAGLSTSPSQSTTYYFPHLAFGGGFQSTLTLVNYSQQSVSCQTSFLADSGSALPVPFAQGSVSSRSDNLAPGEDIHVQTEASAAAAVSAGWAQTQCTGPVKASLLYRYYNQGVPQGEASVNAVTIPDTEFVTFAETHTGIAWANPSATPALVTITALDSATGTLLGTTTITVQPNAHGSANIGPLLNISSFTGSVEITSTVPIVCLSLNAEVFPVFSSLPAGDLPAGTPLATGH